MALTSCPDCNGDVSTSAQACPKCGCQLLTPTGRSLAEVADEEPPWRRIRRRAAIESAAAAAVAPVVPAVGVVAKLRALVGLDVSKPAEPGKGK